MQVISRTVVRVKIISKAVVRVKMISKTVVRLKMISRNIDAVVDTTAIDSEIECFEAAISLNLKH
jgi:hypothetical protein